MSTATARTVSDPRWMLWTGRVLSFVVVAQLLSSAWFRATHHTFAVSEIVAAYGYPESAIVPIVIAECALVVLANLFPSAGRRDWDFRVTVRSTRCWTRPQEL